MKLLGAVLAFGLGFGLAFGSLHLLGDAPVETASAAHTALGLYAR